MKRKRFKKLLMSKRISRNEANEYVKETPSKERQEVLDGIYIISKEHFFEITPGWFEAVKDPCKEFEDFVTRRLGEMNVSDR